MKNIISERKTKKIIVEYIYDYEVNWPPEKYQEFLNWFDVRIKTVPEEYKDLIRIDFENSNSDIKLTISYDRSETDNEMRDRIKTEKQMSEKIRNKELEELKRLTDKYGEIKL